MTQKKKEVPEFKKLEIHGFDYMATNREIIRVEVYENESGGVTVKQSKPHSEKISTDIHIPKDLWSDFAKLINDYKPA
jgi:hypothetical protein